MVKDKDAPPGASALFAEMGRFEVWQKEGHEFMPVASVRAGNLLAALVYTMNRTDAPWSDNEQVIALLPNARSTDLGDVIVNPEGEAYQIQNTRLGLIFKMIDFPQHREAKALFAEWEADYAAAKMRDAQALFGDAPIRSTEPTHAAIDNSKDRGGRE